MQRRSLRSAPAQKTPGTAEPIIIARVVLSAPEEIAESVCCSECTRETESAFLAAGRERSRSFISPVCGAGKVRVVIVGSAVSAAAERGRAC